MPPVRDHTEIRNPADILKRAARPQHNSTHLPHRRDWRYASGVYRHGDIEDTSYRGQENTVWDELDWDTQVGVFGKENRRYAGKTDHTDIRRQPLAEIGVSREEREREREKGGMALDGAVDGDVEGSVCVLVRSLNGGLEERVSGRVREPRIRKMGSSSGIMLKSVAQARKSRKRPCSRASVITGFQRSEKVDSETEEDGETWVQTRMVVCLKFSCKGADEVQRIVGGEQVDGMAEGTVLALPGADEDAEPPSSPSSTQQTAITDAPTVSTPKSTTTSTRSYHAHEPIRALVPIQRQWSDETQDFNMKAVISTLRPPNTDLPALSNFFNWFPNAPPVDAIFPPGVPLSAKEIMAFYPHHIRWKGVTLRLVNNAFYGDSIMPMQAFFRGMHKHPLTLTNIHQFFRDALKSDVPGWKVSEYQGTPDKNIHTGHLQPARFIKDTRQGFVVPTFEDLLRGIEYLPAGIDARGLTECLAWYSRVRDTFSPPLELNVLHTQSLIRALRVPLRSYGPMNLDMRAVQEWKEKGGFAKRRVDDEVVPENANSVGLRSEQLNRSRVTIDPEKETLGVDVAVKLRHVLTFPYLAIGGMFCRALEMGIEKAEARKAAREAQEVDQDMGQAAVAMSDASFGKQVDPQTETSASEKGELPTTKISQYGATDMQGNANGGLERRLTPTMPAGYRIPKRKRPLPEEPFTERDTSTQERPTPGFPNTQLKSYTTSGAEPRIHTPTLNQPLTNYPLLHPSGPEMPVSSFQHHENRLTAPSFGPARSHAPEQYNYSFNYNYHPPPSHNISPSNQNQNQIQNQYRPTPPPLYPSTFPAPLISGTRHTFQNASRWSTATTPQHYHPLDGNRSVLPGYHNSPAQHQYHRGGRGGDGSANRTSQDGEFYRDRTDGWAGSGSRGGYGYGYGYGGGGG